MPDVNAVRAFPVLRFGCGLYKFPRDIAYASANSKRTTREGAALLSILTYRSNYYNKMIVVLYLGEYGARLKVK